MLLAFLKIYNLRPIITKETVCMHAIKTDNKKIVLCITDDDEKVTRLNKNEPVIHILKNRFASAATTSQVAESNKRGLCAGSGLVVPYSSHKREIAGSIPGWAH
jgi:hypothetical protein